MKQNKQYTSAIAETVDASSNFINGVRNPWFLIVIIFIIGGGYIVSKYIPLLVESIDRVSSRLESLSDKLNEQNGHLSKIENGLDKLFETLRQKN